MKIMLEIGNATMEENAVVGDAVSDLDEDIRELDEMIKSTQENIIRLQGVALILEELSRRNQEHFKEAKTHMDNAADLLNELNEKIAML